MPCRHCPPNRRWVAALAIALLTWFDASDALGRSGDAWKACQERVIADLQAAGLRDDGTVSAYTGATGAGAQEAIVARCGYRPEPVAGPVCDQLYRQVYRACREDGFEGLSMAANSWVLDFDPRGRLVARLRRLCAQSARVGRTVFARRLCGE